MTRKIMESAWAKFAEEVVPKSATKRQMRRMKIAFYGGATGLYYGLMGELTGGPEDDARDAALLASIGAELLEFANAVGAGGG